MTRGWIGIQFQSVSPEIADNLGLAKPSGVLVAEVRAASPAAEAGLAVGDVINSVDGQPFANAHAFGRMLDDTLPGTRVALGIVRNGEEMSIAALVGDRPAAAQAHPTQVAEAADVEKDRQPLGLMLMPAEASTGTDGHGAIVVGIDPAGLAAGRGISLGYVILDVASQGIANPAEVYRMVANAQKAGKRSILLRLKSGDTARFIALPIA